MIELIENKIKELKSIDTHFKIFGAEHHKYEFNSEITEVQLIGFEKQHNIELPEFYRKFILHFGSQGCGPNYGLLNLDYAILSTPSYPKESERINLSNDFRFKSHWNINYEQGDYGKWEKEYFEPKWIDGSIRICHEGCGYYVILVVKGSEKGNVWLDARASDGGIFPIGYNKGKTQTKFNEWYINWLNESIKKMKTTGNK